MLGVLAIFLSLIHAILLSGKTCINFNGELGSYFHCKRGLRQGDPPSPLIFNLVADVLNKYLQKIQVAGFIQRLGQFSNIGPVLNLQFTYDTLIFLQADPRMIEALKLYLTTFKNLSSMKINYAKSEMTPLNLSGNEGTMLAEIFGCKISAFPLTYLGIPLHCKKPSFADWQVIINRIENQIQGWKGKLLSIGGRVIFLNSVLSAIPIYWLSIFKIPSKIRMRIDKLRKRFLWYGSDSVRKKYCLVSWDAVCKSKNQWRLGVMNLSRLNQSLSAKWWVRFQDHKITGL